MLRESLPGPKRLRDRLGDEGRVPQRGKPNPEDACLVPRDEGGRHLEREPRLSRATRAGKGQEACSSLDLRENLCELPLPPDEAARRPREVRVRDRFERGKGLRTELVDGDRLRKVLEAVLAELGQRKAVLRDELTRRLGEDDLSAMSRGGDPGCPVQFVTDKARLGHPSLAAPSPDPKRPDRAQDRVDTLRTRRRTPRRSCRRPWRRPLPTTRRGRPPRSTAAPSRCRLRRPAARRRAA